MRSGESADASADHNQVKALAGFDPLSRLLPEIAIAQAVSDFESAHMAAAQAGQRGWIVARSFLGIEIGLEGCQQMRRKSSGSSRDCYSIQKVAAGYAAIHSQVFVSQVVFQVSVFRFQHGPLAHFRLKFAAVI
jgi:hypothetical protein